MPVKEIKKSHKEIYPGQSFPFLNSIPRVLGVCGGNGVILHPFKKYLIANLEPRGIFHTPGNIQWKLNFNLTPMFKNGLDKKLNPVDIIIGAPDCGHASVLSYSRAKKLGNALANDSFNYFVAQVNSRKPSLFMMENLPKLAELQDLDALFPHHILRKYIAPVSRWGNSQMSRVRLVIIGQIHNLNLSWPKFPDTKDFYYPKVSELLEGLGEKEDSYLCHVRERDEWFLPLYHGDRRKITVAEARQLWNTEFRDSKRWVVAYSKMKNQPGVYRVMADDYPLTVRKQSRQFRWDGYLLSPREIARIQGIPDKFFLWHDKKQHLYCINKARTTAAKSPPYEIGQWFYEYIYQTSKQYKIPCKKNF